MVEVVVADAIAKEKTAFGMNTVLEPLRLIRLPTVVPAPIILVLVALS